MLNFKLYPLRTYPALLLVMALFAGVTAVADERILDFHSDILIRNTGSMMVTETIRVRAEGKQIRRGIYRDFPTSYKGRHDNHLM